MRVVADAVVVAAVLFAAAGTLAWRRAWILIAVLLVVRIASALAVFRVNPALLRERATVLVHRRQAWTDRVILLAFMTTAFAGVPAVAAYAGNLLVNVGLGLWLGSYAAALFAVVPLAILMVRIAVEERLLRRELPGYSEYAARVTHRLLPGIW